MRDFSLLRVRTSMPCLALAVIASHGLAQSTTPNVPSNATAVPVTITLADALTRAQANEPAFAAASAAGKVATLDRSIARSALLPTVEAHNQYLYTQSNHLLNTASATPNQAGPRFIANNAIHEYVSQAVVTETLGLKGFAALQQATATAAHAAAELEVARRGLITTVVGLYFGSLAANRKVAIAQRAASEADTFTDLTTKRENAREVAHADVVKAQLQQQQRQRELADTVLAADKARLELAVLLFPDPRTIYILQTPDASSPIPPRAQIEAAAGRENPEIRSALASLHLAQVNVLSARAAYLPDLTLNYAYGIDAAQFAAKGPDGARNLGYSASATLDIPVWNWFATQNKIKQAYIQRQAAQVTLTAAQRHLIATLDETYAEAISVRDQLQLLDASVQTATESLHLTRLRYINGESTVLEVVDAENTLTSTENAREDGAVRYQAALANLQTLTGTF